MLAPGTGDTETNKQTDTAKYIINGPRGRLSGKKRKETDFLEDF